MEEKKFKIKKTNFWIWILIAVIVVLGLFSLTSFLFFNEFGLPTKPNEIGDSFGVANAIFSALAFAFLIVTAIMQRKELEMQREELTGTRVELERSADAHKATERAMSIQVRIMAKQAILSSYQSMYQVNMDIISRSSSHPYSIPNENLKLKKEADSYKDDMEDLISEIRGDMKLFGDPLMPEKKKELRDYVAQLFDESKEK